MKRIFGIFVFASLIAFSSAVWGQANLKIGYIDSNELLGLMPGKDSVETKLMEYQKSLESQIEMMLTEYQAKVQQYRSTAATMSDIIKQTTIILAIIISFTGGLGMFLSRYSEVFIHYRLYFY